MSGARLAVNVLAFQAAWLGSGAALGRLWVGPVSALVVVAWLVVTAVRRRRELGAVLAAVAGPLCYRAAAALGALTLPAPLEPLAVEAPAWAVLLPLTVAPAARSNGLRAAVPRHASNV